MNRPRTPGAAACAVSALLAAWPLAAQTAAPDSVTITPNADYLAGPLHRLLFSSGHRELWATPIRAEVLDLDRFAGGLQVGELGGGLQTRSIRFRGRDGREYAFRSIDKDASRTLDPLLRRSVAANVLQDQIGSLLPLGALVVAPLLEAAGVLQVQPKLVVMPDDARLGEHRATFAGLLGFIEERPNEGEGDLPGFAGADLVISTPDFFDQLEESSRHRIDDAAYVRARLIDILVGDWDRHPDQWRWAGFGQPGGTVIWRPIPRDRDWALARMDGLLISLVPIGYPHYVGFGRNYPSIFRLTWSARALDRQLLSGTPRETWDAVAADLQRRLDDRVIADAVRRLPPPHFAHVGDELAESLRRRRDALPGAASDFYEQLAGWVDVFATDQRDLVEVVRLDSARLRVSMTSGERASSSGAEPYFQRVFDARETREVRVYLRGGADHAAIIGPGAGGPIVRIIGGGGDDALIDRTTGRNVFLYDDRGDNRFETAGGTSVDRSAWEQPADSSAATHQARARDWGARWLVLPSLSYDADFGAFIGATATRTGYGFREYPYATRLFMSAGYGTTAGRLRVRADYDFPVMGRTWRGLLHARYSGAEVDRFYGFGNGTTAGGPDAYYEAQRAELNLEARFGARVRGSTLTLGPVFRANRPFHAPGTFLDSVAPYGAGNFTEAGVVAQLEWDGRNRPKGATRGAFVRLRGRVFPDVLDVTETFGGARVDAAAYLTAPVGFEPTLAVRAGAEKLWGSYPWFEAAFIGGRHTLRGYNNERFAGDGSLYGSAELRLGLIRHNFLFPGRIGVLALGDAGRVFLSDEDSNEVHGAAGGGVWLSFVNPGNTLTITVANSPERTAVYVGAGFAF